jgi:DNA-directed RNA polymerase specialized sigma24 family protein
VINETLDLILHIRASRGSSHARDFLITVKLATSIWSLQAESGVYVATQELLREEPKLTQVAFHRLLAWLDDGVDSKGETYIEMRRRLVAYFDRRNRPFADDLADETFNRISRTIEKSGPIEIKPPARYCYVVARFVLLEDVRRSRRYVPVDESRDTVPFGPRPFSASDTVESVQEQRLGCLDRCLDKLKPDQRELAIEYYREAKRERIDRRRALAERLRITMNALGVRACRIRHTLEVCVDDCCKGR